MPLRTTPCENEQIERAKQGDDKAFERLLESYKWLVRARASRFYLQGADHEDLIQEGMIGLFKAVRDYRPGHSSFRSFADLCVQRQIITAVKTASRQKHFPLNFARSLDAPAYMGTDGRLSIETIEGEPESRVENRTVLLEEIKSLEAALKERLSRLEYEVLRLRLQGRSYGEIAETLGTRLKSVDCGLFRAKIKIRQIIGTGGGKAAPGDT